MFVGQYRVPGNPVQECLKHPFPPCDHCCILLSLRLLDGIISYCLLGWDRWNNERRIKLGQIRSQRLELRIPMMSRCILHTSSQSDVGRSGDIAHPRLDDISDVRRSSVDRGLLCVSDLLQGEVLVH